MIGLKKKRKKEMKKKKPKAIHLPTSIFKTWLLLMTNDWHGYDPCKSTEKVLEKHKAEQIGNYPFSKGKQSFLLQSYCLSLLQRPQSTVETPCRQTESEKKGCVLEWQKDVIREIT